MNPPTLEAKARSKAFNTGILLLVMISFFWGINWPVMKVALDEVPIWMFRAICLAVGGLGLLGIAHGMGHPLRLPRRMLWPIVAVSFFNISVWHLTSAAGIANMAAGRAAIIAFTMPLWAAVLAAPFLGERLNRTTAAGLVIGLLGLAALLLPDMGALIANPIGPIFMLVAAASWAAGTVGLKYYRWPMPSIVLAGWQELIGGIPIFIGAIIFDSDFVPSAASTEAWLATIFSAIIPMMLCHWAWFHIVGTFPAVVAAIGTLAIPVIGVISSAVALSEPIGIDSIAALVLVLTALTVVLIVPALRRRSAGGCRHLTSEHARRLRDAFGLHRAGRLAEAETGYREVLALQPDLVDAHLGLGNLLRDGDRLDEAAEQYRRAITLDPNCAPALNNLGNLKRRQNNADAAVAWLQRAVAAAPADATILNNLAVALQSAGQRDEAIRRYRAALALDPGFASALAGLGTMLAEEGDHEEAIDFLGQALDCEPSLADLRANLANALAAVGRHEDALAQWRRLVAERPDIARYRIKLGDVLRQLGRFEDAREAFAETLARHPDNAAALAEAVGDRASTTPAEIEARIARRLALPDLPLADRARLRFAMVKVHEARGDDDGAFAELALANEARRRQRAERGQVFDVEALARQFDRVIATFDGARLGGQTGFGDPSPCPVFIVGMPRSGTSLVEQILASHSRAHGAGELGYMEYIARDLRERTGADAPYPLCVDRLDAPLSRRIAKDYLGALRKRAPEAERITDKAPLNFLYLGLIALLLPGARIIHCRRGAMDTCLSCYEQDFQGPMTWAWDLTTLGQFYDQYTRLMAHWRRVLPNAFLELDYETVVNDTRRAAQAMVEFCGLDWEEQCLDFHRTERAVLTFSLAQVRRPIYATSVGKWRRYRRHLGPLIEALGDLTPGVGQH